MNPDNLRPTHHIWIRVESDDGARPPQFIRYANSIEDLFLTLSLGAIIHIEDMGGMELEVLLAITRPAEPGDTGFRTELHCRPYSD